MASTTNGCGGRIEDQGDGGPGRPGGNKRPGDCLSMVAAQPVASIPAGACLASAAAPEAQPFLAGLVACSAAGSDACHRVFALGHAGIGPRRRTGYCVKSVSPCRSGWRRLGCCRPYLKAAESLPHVPGNAGHHGIVQPVHLRGRAAVGRRPGAYMLIGAAVVGLLLSLAINLAGWSCRSAMAGVASCSG